jgi:hypothetical protein
MYIVKAGESYDDRDTKDAQMVEYQCHSGLLKLHDE